MKGPSVETQAWVEEPPRGGQPITREQTFIRDGFTWVGEWLRRNKDNHQLMQIKPFAIILCQETAYSPRNDTFLEEKSPTEIAIRSYDCPAAGGGLIFVNQNIREARALTNEFQTVNLLLTFMKDQNLLDRLFIVVNPAQSAAGLHRAGDSIEDFETQIIVSSNEPDYPLTTSIVDTYLSRIHKNCFEKPKQPFRRQFWSDPSKAVTVERAEKIVQEILMMVFTAQFGEDRVLCDEEVEVPSGRADIRLLIAKDDMFRMFWLELKVLRESDKPAGRKTNTITCIDQARGRRKDKFSTTEASFACCYDASIAHCAFDSEITAHAANEPTVLLRKYDLLQELY